MSQAQSYPWAEQIRIHLRHKTRLGKGLNVMVVGGAYRGRCIALAWRCYCPDADPSEGQVRLIAALPCRAPPALPAGRRPVAEADRGIGTSPDRVCAVAAREPINRCFRSCHHPRSRFIVCATH